MGSSAQNFNLRQPIHVLYGGAHLFKAESISKLGSIAINTLEQYAPDSESLIRSLGISVDSEISSNLHKKIKDKLALEPIEDYRIDFEDGYGIRSDTEEDAEAVRVAEEVAKALAQNLLPQSIGIRIKPFSNELKLRAIKTLKLFFETLINRTRGKIPTDFIVTLPKINSTKEVELLCGLIPDSVKVEVMIETPSAVITPEGNFGIRSIVLAAKGRCVAAHLGAYDYLSSLDISSNSQSLSHQSCDFVRNLMSICLAGTGVRLSDGATNLIPVPIHRAKSDGKLTSNQIAENRVAVHNAWKLHFDNVTHALDQGFYQGWDLHPAQLIPRYAATYLFFLRSIEGVIARLSNFVSRSAQASLVGNEFDDAATAQGLLNFVARALDCGAISQSDLTRSGLTIEQVRRRSFSNQDGSKC